MPAPPGREPHRRSRCVFLAGATFNLLPRDEGAAEALSKIALILEPDGSALVPLFVPTPTPPGRRLGRYDRIGRRRDSRDSVAIWNERAEPAGVEDRTFASWLHPG